MKNQVVEKSQNLAEVELIYKSKIKAADRATVKSSNDVFEYLKGVYDENRVEHIEEFVIVLCNTRLQVLGWVKPFTGGIAGTVVDVRVIMQAALKANASSIFISHNHPSGGLVPSEQDKSITKKIAEAGKILDVRLNDHIIYTPDGYYSFSDEGMLY